MNRRQFLMLPLVVIAVSPCAGSLQDIQDCLKGINTLKAKFVQSKYFASRPNPLIATGYLFLKKGTGVVWDQEQPFPQKIIMTPDRLRILLPDKEYEEITKEKNAAMFELFSTLSSVFLAEIDLLTNYFQVKEETAVPSWKFMLIPSTKQLTNIFESIEISGDKSVREVSIIERSGDRTSISFTDRVINGSLPDEITDALQR